MQWQPTQLQNDLVKLLLLTADSFNELYKVASDPLIWEQHPDKDRYKEEVFKIYFDGALNSGTAFLIYDNKNGELAGCTRFYDYRPNESTIAIGYTFIARKYWGGEFNGAVKRLLLQYAFNYVNAVVFHIGSTNIRSQRAVEKIGGEKFREVEMDSKVHFEYKLTKEKWARGEVKQMAR